jgi:membrane protein required for colicin V production
MPIEGYDLVMVGILAAAAMLGYFKGIVWQLAWIAGIAASAAVALRFGGPLAPFFGSQAPWNRLVAMLALYAATSLAVWLAFSVVSSVIKTVKLSAFDHQMGLLLGLAKGALLCVVVTFFAVTLTPNYRDQIVGSRSGRLVAELIVRADQILPPDVVATVAPFVQRFEDELNKPAGPNAAPGLPGGGAAAGIATPSPLQAIWEGVQSAAAWTGAEQGGQGGGNAFFAQPAGGASAVGSTPHWQPLPPGHPAAQPAQPERPTSSGFTRQPAFQPPPAPPGAFPMGAQTPLPIR